MRPRSIIIESPKRQVSSGSHRDPLWVIDSHRQDDQEVDIAWEHCGTLDWRYRSLRYPERWRSSDVISLAFCLELEEPPSIRPQQHHSDSEGQHNNLRQTTRHHRGETTQHSNIIMETDNNTTTASSWRQITATWERQHNSSIITGESDNSSASIMALKKKNEDVELN